MTDYNGLTLDELEAKQAQIINWILKFGKHNPRYYEAGKAITEITQTIIKKSGDITLEAKKTAGLIHFAKEFQDPLIEDIKQSML